MTLRSDFKIHEETPTAPSRKGAIEEGPFSAVALHLTTLLPDLQEAAGEPADEAEGDASRPRRVAMLVTHGMGQQVPYETLSAIGQALITQHMKGKSEDAPTPSVNVRRVTLTDAENAPELSRVEVSLKGACGPPVDVHIYESYWAPLTEGQISFLQTVVFLLSAGWNGIKTYFTFGYKGQGGRKAGIGQFDRWMFGDFHAMPIKRGSLMGLVWAMLVAVCVFIPPLLLFTPMGLSICKWLYGKYHAVFLSSSHIVQAGVILGVILLAMVAYWIRYFLVEFVGDVAIYVSSYKVSRFNAIRASILDSVCKVSHEIYSAGIADDHQPRYDSVVIVGHSLGSVISYDLLNEAINWDEVQSDFKYRVVERTTRLITFGSPLDKTAFLFRTQVRANRNLREALAARQQPLILNYKQYRPKKTFTWVNIYSPMDVVSGHLDYYDVLSEDDCNPVINVIDWQSWVPLMAHTQYWTKQKLHETLYHAVCDGGVAGSSGRAGAQNVQVVADSR